MWMDIVGDNDSFTNAIESFDNSMIESSHMDFSQSPFIEPLPVSGAPLVPQYPIAQSFLSSNYQPSPSFSSVGKHHQKDEFNEEYLVTLDYDSFQDYVLQVRKRRSLTRAEEESVKRLIKKMKNRESARKSRLAKKEISQELDEQVGKLTDQTHSLKLEVAALYATNQQIKNEISFSEKLIASNPFLSNLYAKTMKGEPVQSNQLKAIECNTDAEIPRCNPSTFRLASNPSVAAHS